MLLVAMAFVLRPLLSDSRAPRMTLFFVIAIVLFAVGFYTIIGRPDLLANASISQPQDTKWAKPEQTAKKSVAPVASLLESLEKKLAENPDDGGGWLLLAKSYDHLGQSDKAREAYAKAEALGNSDPKLSAMFSDSAEQQTNKAQDSLEIRGSVQLSEDIQTTFDSHAVVFVVARNANGAGAPLAVIRKPVSDLPFEFVLNDSMSMVKGAGLSSVDEVVVRAIISKSGNVTNEASEFEATSAVMAVRDAPTITLIIEPTQRSK